MSCPHSSCFTSFVGLPRSSSESEDELSHKHSIFKCQLTHLCRGLLCFSGKCLLHLLYQYQLTVVLWVDMFNILISLYLYIQTNKELCFGLIPSTTLYIDISQCILINKQLGKNFVSDGHICTIFWSAQSKLENL